MRKRGLYIVMAAACSMMIAACGGTQISETRKTETPINKATEVNAAPMETEGNDRLGEADGDAGQTHPASGLSSAQALNNPTVFADTWNDSPEGLLAHASPSTSAMTLYTYDGKTVKLAYIFDVQKEQEILDSLNAVKAEKVKGWTAGDAGLPVYGLDMGRDDGYTIYAAWTNGHWIAQDGTVYRFDYDFGQLAEQKAWQDEGELPSFTSFPCARIFAQEKDGWNTRFLVPAPPLNPPRGITMKLDSWDQDLAVVSITNQGSEEWTCGEFYEIQVLIDGVWYEVPTVPGNWGFNCMGYYVPTGETQSLTSHMAMYGQLPPGTYRFVINGLSVEHRIP